MTVDASARILQSVPYTWPARSLAIMAILLHVSRHHLTAWRTDGTRVPRWVEHALHYLHATDDEDGTRAYSALWRLILDYCGLSDVATLLHCDRAQAIHRLRHWSTDENESQRIIVRLQTFVQQAAYREFGYDATLWYDEPPVGIGIQTEHEWFTLTLSPSTRKPT